MRVLVVDDQPLHRQALAALLRTLDATVEVVEAADAAAALAELDAAAATESESEAGDGGVPPGGIGLVIIDPALGDPEGASGSDGFSTLAAIRRRHPQVPVAAMGSAAAIGDVVRAIDLGAMGFVPKRSTLPELRHALTIALAGGVCIPPALLDRLERVRAAAPGPAPSGEAGPRAPAPAAAGPDAPRAASPAADAPRGISPEVLRRRSDGLDVLGLTPRQTDVLAGLLKGQPNKLIARDLGLSVETVKDHVAAVLRALKVANRTHAVLAVGRLIEAQRAGAAPR